MIYYSGWTAICHPQVIACGCISITLLSDRHLGAASHLAYHTCNLLRHVKPSLGARHLSAAWHLAYHTYNLLRHMPATSLCQIPWWRMTLGLPYMQSTETCASHVSVPDTLVPHDTWPTIHATYWDMCQPSLGIKTPWCHVTLGWHICLKSMPC